MIKGKEILAGVTGFPNMKEVAGYHHEWYDGTGYPGGYSGEEIPEFVSPSTLDRETVVFPVIDKSLCVGCGRCYISCWDGGHQAISLGEDRKPKINGAKCVGCHLCRLVCPTDAIGISKRVPKVRK